MGRRPGITAEETRHALLTAAMKVFAEQGVGQAQASAIAAEAGVTPAAIYRHFESREELVTAAIEENAAELVADVLTGDFDGDLGQILFAIGSSLTQRPREFSTVLLEL